jgi:serine/threonine protein kinase
MSDTDISPEIPHRFQKLAKIGEGTYGIVFQARDTTTGQIVALKFFKLDQEEDGIPSSTLREMSILKTMNHPNIVILEDVIIQPGQLCFVFEFVRTDLRGLLRKHGPLQPDTLQSYAFQMLCGLYTLHTHRIMHRDLKPDNLLVTRDRLLKISDFGLSRYFTIPVRQYSPNVVSTWYKAPELMLGTRIYDISIDVWSVGCIIAEMVTGGPFFKGDSDVDQLHRVFRVLGMPSESDRKTMGDISGFSLDDTTTLQDSLKVDDPYLIDIIAKMLIYDPTKRLSVVEALTHPFFDSIPDSVREKCWPPGLARKN